MHSYYLFYISTYFCWKYGIIGLCIEILQRYLKIAVNTNGVCTLGRSSNTSGQKIISRGCFVGEHLSFSYSIISTMVLELNFHWAATVDSTIGAHRAVWVPGQDLDTPHLMRNCRKRILSLHCTLYVHLSHFPWLVTMCLCVRSSWYEYAWFEITWEIPGYSRTAGTSGWHNRFIHKGTGTQLHHRYGCCCCEIMTWIIIRWRRTAGS